MPAGSNPSYLDAEQYDALQQAFPQVARASAPSTRPARASACVNT